MRGSRLNTAPTSERFSRGRWRPAPWLIALAAMALVAGCASGPRIVRTDVTSFDAWASLPADKSYVFARTLEFQGSLEMQTYEDIVRDELAMKGFTLASDPSRARLVVTLRPSVMGTQIRVRDPWPDPLWRPWGGYYGGWGGWGGGWYGRGWYDPFWGLNDWRYEQVDVYRRRLELDIDAKDQPGKRYYEGRVENTADNGALPAVMPYLIRALFTDFPGNSGQTRRIDVPVEPGAPKVAQDAGARVR